MRGERERGLGIEKRKWNGLGIGSRVKETEDWKGKVEWELEGNKEKKVGDGKGEKEGVWGLEGEIKWDGNFEREWERGWIGRGEGKRVGD